MLDKYLTSLKYKVNMKFNSVFNTSILNIQKIKMVHNENYYLTVVARTIWYSMKRNQKVYLRIRSMYVIKVSR